MAERFIPTPAELEAAATRRRDLPVGFVEIGIGHAVRLADIFDVHETAGVTGCTVQLHGSYFDRTTYSPLTYHALLERLRQAQRDELAEPGDPFVLYMLRDALEHLPEDRRQWLDHQVRQLLREARGAVTIPPNVTVTRDAIFESSTYPVDAVDQPASPYEADADLMDAIEDAVTAFFGPGNIYGVALGGGTARSIAGDAVDLLRGRKPDPLAEG